MDIYKNKQILITGGTGSFGKAFCNFIITKKYKIKRLVIFSRDEFKQSEMSKVFPEKKYPFIRYFIGDVRDKDRLHRAMEGIDYVIHAAALKHVNLGEYNPMEVVKTNIVGAQNIVDTCLDKKIKNVIALSTDKASSPINLYGASKLCSDKIFLAANNIKGKKNIKFSIVRYGNVLGSRGSVLPIFLNCLKNKDKFTITHKDMTRFNITLNEGIEFVDWCLRNNNGGEIFIPKLKSFRVTDLAKAVYSKAKFKIIGIRPGEKLHEELISETDSLNTAEGKKFYVILNLLNHSAFSKYLKNKRLKKVKSGFKYSSDNNKSVINSKNLRIILKKHNFI